jgi:hypothetical protein
MGYAPCEHCIGPSTTERGVFLCFNVGRRCRRLIVCEFWSCLYLNAHD